VRREISVVETCYMMGEWGRKGIRIRGRWDEDTVKVIREGEWERWNKMQLEPPTNWRVDGHGQIGAIASGFRRNGEKENSRDI
jgi:hypothetical protein